MRRYRGLCRAIEWLCIALFVLACMVGALTACSGVRAIPLARKDSTHTAVYQRDTVRLVDSVYTREYQRADMVYRTREVVQMLSPERYVPRFYRVCTTILCLLISGEVVWGVLRVWVRR